MTQDDSKKDDQQQLPDYVPLPPESSTEEADTEEAAAASDTAPDINPVFGGTSQPQQVSDDNIVGVNNTPVPLNGEDSVIDFDPEKDSRVQRPPTE